MKKSLLLIILLITLLSGCKMIEYNDVDVLFESNGGTEIEMFVVRVGKAFIEPLTPLKDDYLFSGWYSDLDLTNLYDFENPISDAVTLYAKWDLEILYIVPTEGIIDVTSLPYYEYMSPENPVVTITIKGVGVMTIELFPEVAPNTVNNFISYVQNGDYANNNFHRVIENFMIQGGRVSDASCQITGDFSTNGITNDLPHYRGAISMARTNVMNSATSQFFIVHKNSNFLDESYATFGGLISGFNVLDYIARVTTGANDVPLQSIIILGMTVEMNDYIPSDRICANIT